MIRQPDFEREADRHRYIREAAAEFGILAYHPGRSAPIYRGFPDWVLAGTRVLFREDKDSRGRLTAEQVQWRWSLLAAGADYAVWLPDDFRYELVRAQLKAITVKR